VRRRTVVDSGPLVALFDRDDAHHATAKDFLRKFKGELISDLPVVTEIMYLLDFSVQAQVGFLGWLLAGGATLIDLTAEDLRRTAELLEKYTNLPADFADATLVAVSERVGVHEIATVDRDFGIYRLKGKKKLRNIFPVR
jgi:predicted nucleic acid-binding protein